MQTTLRIFTLAGCLAAFSVSAAEPSQAELYQKLAECQASTEQVEAFNALADAEQVTFAKDEEHSPWGGAAWRVDPALKANGVSSPLAVMTDRNSFFLQSASTAPLADAAKLASALKLRKTLDTDGYVDYQRTLDNGATLRVVSTEDKNTDLYVGCSYPQN
ncbi:hypothetical protein [Pantoea sp. Cy-639]|uniref:hypothetical protein n=1 Tax=Pantoea sp. Cy-639 TaxID=2608360 RepID=UPI00141DE684|nr:hypothetical protein [Pantoea sp. Cy-639]NIF16991.1 hypothetical protein [Pantoea sp. Cy-639]